MGSGRTSTHGFGWSLAIETPMVYPSTPVRAPSPKTRRATIAALGIIAAAALMLGARGPVPDHPLSQRCEDDLGYVFDSCRDWRKCTGLDDEFMDACVAACVLTYCPEQVECTGLDPVFCARCDDMQGALFWHDMTKNVSQCTRRTDAWETIPEVVVDAAKEEAFDACFVAEMEQNCPELAGTDWLARFDRIGRFPRERRGAARDPRSVVPSSQPR